MDIKYYVNYTSGSVEAINMDNVKKIYIECCNDNSNNLSMLYFDDIKIHVLDKDKVEDKINEIVNSEEKILEIYNSDISKIKFSEENRNRIFMNGFNPFKEFIKSSHINIESFTYNFNMIGVRSYIELLKSDNKIGGNGTIDYIVRFIIIFMYSKHINEIS